MVILSDMDDTIEGLVPEWVSTLNRLYGTQVSPGDITQWDILAVFPGLTEEQVFSPLYSEEFWQRVRPLPGAAEYLQKLSDEGHEIYIVTASFLQSGWYKFKTVMRTYFPFIREEQMIIAFKKQMVLGDVLIDDNPDNLVGGHYRGLLMDAPYNQDFDETRYPNILRVHNWEEIYRALQA